MRQKGLNSQRRLGKGGQEVRQGEPRCGGDRAGSRPSWEPCLPEDKGAWSLSTGGKISHPLRPSSSAKMDLLVSNRARRR